ncbi:cytoskeleton-associated protein 4 [Ascaphus truei]|uniref:cytoskeleton-associated protein 4 n=1 Tax=Ascaphus truei TaxID=8439 RepID=UPI003F5AD4B1
MSNAKQRNKSHLADRSSPPAASDDVAKKNSKPNKGAAPAASPHTANGLWKVANFVFYAGLVAVAGYSGWCVHHVLEEVSQITSRNEHLSQQKGELAESVDSLLKQVNLHQISVGRLEFIFKDIQEKQQINEAAIKMGEKEVDRIGLVLKKLQNEILKDLSDGIQDVKDARERDLPFFEKNVEEKLTELTTSINENIAIFTDVQTSSQNEMKNVKAKLASLAETHSVKDELKALQDIYSELQTSSRAKDVSMEQLQSTVQNVESVVTVTNEEFAVLRNEHDYFKEAVEAQLTAIDELKENGLKSEEFSTHVAREIERLDRKSQSITSTIADKEKMFISNNDDILKQIESNKNGIESRLKAIVQIVETLNSGTAQQPEVESFISSFEEYTRRLNAVEEALAGMKFLSTDDTGSPAAMETLSTLKESQQTLSIDVDELKSIVADLTNTAPEFQKLQVEVTSLLETQKHQIEELQYNQGQKSKAETSVNDIELIEKISHVDGLQSSVNKVETDLKTLRTAVDSLVAYSAKIEANGKDLESVKDSIDELKQNNDKLLVKMEEIQETL